MVKPLSFLLLFLLFGLNHHFSSLTLDLLLSLLQFHTTDTIKRLMTL